MTVYKPQKNIRLKDYDYHTGWFFITNKTDFNRPILIGKTYLLVRREIENISQICEGVSLDYAIIVPTHIHCILIFDESVLPLSEVWRRFKARCTMQAKKEGFLGKSLWQRNYFEHVIRNERALDRIRIYIQNNPLKEDLPLDEIYGFNN